MSVWQTWAERVRRGEELPFPVAALLTAATPVFRAGMLARLMGPRVRVDAHVVSFGNLTAGGTGKTPAVIERACAEIKAGKRVAVLTRGYGATPIGRGEVLVRTGGDTPEDLCASVGDEPALIAMKAPESLIVRSADRVAAARKAIEEFHCNVLILDDGYQYVRLERDENVLVIDASNPFGTGHLLPRGILREPIEAMDRASAMLLTRCDQADDLDGLLGVIEECCPGAPVRMTRHAPCALWRVSDKAQHPLEFLEGKEVTAVCAIGNPEAFLLTLESLGAVVAQHLSYPDHSEFPMGCLSPGVTIVTTEKDAMRIREAPPNVYALGVALEDYQPQNIETEPAVQTDVSE